MAAYHGEQISKSQSKKKWFNLAAVFLLLILAVSAAAGALLAGPKIVYADRIYPGVKINGLAVGGQTQDEVYKRFETMEKELQATGLKFEAEGKTVAFNPIIVSETDPDLAKTVFVYDWRKMIDAAYAVGRGGNVWQNLGQQLQALAAGKEITVSYNLDEEMLLSILAESFSALEKPPLDARLDLTAAEPAVTPEQAGIIFNYQAALAKLRQNLAAFNFSPVTLSLTPTEPEIKAADTALALKALDKILAVKAVKITTEEKTWDLKQEVFKGWLEFQLQDNAVMIGINEAAATDYLKTLAAEIEVPALDAKFTIKDNKVTEFVASQDGITVDLVAAYQKLSAQILAGDDAAMTLPLMVKKADINISDVNNLGIKELLGRGTSNFKGSPKNRRANIAVGAKSLNGLIIKPNEDFSLLKALGPVDGEHGYLQELVIKGNRTIPEYGGGLCQIGTTAFRVALNSGLPITQRRNHSYRVVYYEPAGMDATIYDPQPDLRFLNDTGNNILFITKIAGDNVIFEFYGTRDGRTVNIAPNPPRIFNVTSPGPIKYVETDTLKPGEKKKLESAHNGADTYFKYTITYAGGEVKETEFNSHYVAWPEVWLVGATPSSTPETAEAPLVTP